MALADEDQPLKDVRTFVKSREFLHERFFDFAILGIQIDTLIRVHLVLSEINWLVAFQPLERNTL